MHNSSCITRRYWLLLTVPFRYGPFLNISDRYSSSLNAQQKNKPTKCHILILIEYDQFVNVLRISDLNEMKESINLIIENNLPSNISMSEIINETNVDNEMVLHRECIKNGKFYNKMIPISFNGIWDKTNYGTFYYLWSDVI